MSNPIVTIDQVRKVYEPYSRWMKLMLRTAVTEPVVALDGVSFDVYPGELRVILGPNGAGKSTLFRVLTGLTTPTSGTATVLGLDSAEDSTKVRKLVGFMPAENRTLLLRHSCRENLSFHGRLQAIPESKLADRVDETLELVGLYESRDRVGFALSTGMLARLMLARAILHTPSVLILDEPTGAVDPIGAYELLRLVQKIASENDLAVLISSHRLDEVEMLNDQVLLLNRGQTVYNGPLEAMMTSALRPKVEIVFGEPAAAGKALQALQTLQRVADVEDVIVEGNTVVVGSTLSLAQIVTELDGQVDNVSSIGHTRPKLRDVLEEMLRPEPGDS
ncbi:MAG TPA: ABC transporter ATP-binding protein [Acidimicrobiia bacterium]|nr:ABC transporter ATP-binding protein [Acidimicrobiia bacterium]